MLYRCCLDLGLDNLMRRVQRKLNEPKLLQQSQPAQRIVSA